MTTLILASASPRRLELLRQVGLHPEVVAAEIDESRLPGEAPLPYARRLALHKARTIAERSSTLSERPSNDRATLGADTIVTHGDEIFGKPRDVEDARRMLTLLSQCRHRVITAYCILHRGEERSRAIETEVTFRSIGSLELDGYLASQEWSGKAGAYAIQGLAAAFVRSVNGSYTNVVGLPVCEVIEDLRAIGVLSDAWVQGGHEHR